MRQPLYSVDPPGLEPGLFWTKTRRVASYTMGQWCFPFCKWTAKIVFLIFNREVERRKSFEIFQAFMWFINRVHIIMHQLVK